MTLDLAKLRAETLALIDGYMGTKAGAVTLRLLDEIERLAAENERLRAERDAAWQAGAEAMRSSIADQVVLTHRNCVLGARHGPRHRRAYETGRVKALETVADAIRALPLPGQPREDAPPFQAPTLDDLLSVATDDEADAIRVCAERLAETEGGA